jgi:hypothetical protein
MLLATEIGEKVDDVKLEGVEGASGNAEGSNMKTSRVGVRASGKLYDGTAKVVSG